MQFVDPVVVFVDNGDASFLEMNGSALARAAMGRVYKIYSPHGRWVTDANEDMEGMMLDHGTSCSYTLDAVAIGTGYIPHGLIRTPSVWFEDAASEAEVEVGLLHRLRWKAAPSRLGPKCVSSSEKPNPPTIPGDSGAARTELSGVVPIDLDGGTFNRPSIRLPAAVSTAIQDDSPGRFTSAPAVESSTVIANNHEENTSFDLDDRVPARPTVRLPATAPTAAPDDQPSRASMFPVDGVCDALDSPSSNCVLESLSGSPIDALPTDITEDMPARPDFEADSASEEDSSGHSEQLFSTDQDLNSGGIPCVIPRISSEGHSDHLLRSEKTGFDDHYAGVVTKSRHWSSSQSSMEKTESLSLISTDTSHQRTQQSHYFLRAPEKKVTDARRLQEGSVESLEKLQVRLRIRAYSPGIVYLTNFV